MHDVMRASLGESSTYAWGVRTLGCTYAARPIRARYSNECTTDTKEGLTTAVTIGCQELGTPFGRKSVMF